MKKYIKVTYTDAEFRQIIREEMQAVLNAIPGLPRIDIDEGYMTVDETSKYINLAKSTVYGLIHRNQIPYHKSGKKVLFKKTELNSWLAPDIDQPNEE